MNKELIQNQVQEVFTLGYVLGNLFIHSFSQHPNLELIVNIPSDEFNRYLAMIMELNSNLNPEIQFYKISNNQELFNFQQTMEDRSALYINNYKRLVVIVENIRLKEIQEVLEYNHINFYNRIGIIALTTPANKNRKKLDHLQFQYEVTYRDSNSSEVITINTNQELIISSKSKTRSY